MATGALSQYASFPFDTDESFKVGTCQSITTRMLRSMFCIRKQGLADILSSNPQLSEAGNEMDRAMLRQIKVFFFNR